MPIQFYNPSKHATTPSPSSWWRPTRTARCRTRRRRRPPSGRGTGSTSAAAAPERARHRKGRSGSRLAARARGGGAQCEQQLPHSFHRRWNGACAAPPWAIGLGSTPSRWIGKKLGEWIGEGGTEGVELSATNKGREGRQRIREDDDDNQCSLWVCSRRERKERGDERKKKARGILVHKI